MSSKSDALRVTTVSPRSSAVGRDHKIGTIVAESSIQRAPTSCRSQVEWHHPFAIENQNSVKRDFKCVGKGAVNRALSRDARF